MEDTQFDKQPTKINLNVIKPVFTLIGYNNLSETQPYFEFRKIDEFGKMGYAKPLYKDTLKELVKAVKVEDVKQWVLKGKLNKNILCVEPQKQKIVWVLRKSKQYLHFNDDELKSGTYNLPNIVFKFNKGQLFVYAIKRIAENSMLYAAPFFNVYSNNTLCWGNLIFNPKNYHINTIMDEIEKLFFGSMFTHSNNGNIIIDKKYSSYMNSIVNTNTQFNDELLKPTHTKLKNIYS